MKNLFYTYLIIFLFPLALNGMSVDTSGTAETIVENVVLCPGEVYDGPLTPGVPDTSFVNGVCTITILNLSYHPQTLDVYQTACENGMWQPGVYTIVVQDANGCEFLNVLEVLAAPFDVTTTAEICEGDEFEWNNQIYNVAGTYTTISVDDNGCEFEDVLHLNFLPLADCDTDVSDIKVDRPVYSVYPNPCFDQLQLTTETKANGTDSQMEIYNKEGRLISSSKLTRKTKTIDVQDLSPGFYLLKIYNNENQTEILSFIKQ